jgi:hypothetical protein
LVNSLHYIYPFHFLSALKRSSKHQTSPDLVTVNSEVLESTKSGRITHTSPPTSSVVRSEPLAVQLSKIPQVTMFDENFSFLSSTASPASCGSNDTISSSPEVSPFSSRCSSPLPHHAQQNSSLALRQRDNRYNSRPSLTKISVPRHPSITALTAEFESQLLDSPSDLSSPPFSHSNVSTPNTELDYLDEGFVEPDHHHTSSSSSSVSSFDPSLWDLSMADLNTTSYPAGSPPMYAQRRRQRQALVRLQCLSRRAPDLAMLVEECHPSSLPLMSKVRAKSISSGGGRVEKERSNSISVVRRMPRMRKRATR